MTVDRSDNLLALTADIVVAHIANNEVGLGDLRVLISGVHRALGGLGNSVEPAAEPPKPAVPIRSSVTPDYLVCLEDGRKLKMLKRYLMNRHGMTPDEYRAKWNLPADYPMAAPNYSAVRKALAERSGLGRKSAAAPSSESVPAAPRISEPDIPAPAKRKVLKPLFVRRDDKDGDQPKEPGSSASTQPIDMLCAAIARRMCVAATYNKRSVILAPHVVYNRHGEPFLRAVTVEQDGRRPKELKLGTFKLAGLGGLAATTRPLVRFPGYPADEIDYAEDMIYALPST